MNEREPTINQSVTDQRFGVEFLNPLSRIDDNSPLFAIRGHVYRTLGACKRLAPRERLQHRL
jgi:hypothetical protein